MDYISCESAAKKMGVSARRIQQMCKQKEIVGAIKDGRNWLIPDNAILSPKKPLPIGVSDFKSATTNYYYVDKTLLIRDFLNAIPMVSLFTRPRRFGKTLNMDMLRVFFEKTSDNTCWYWIEYTYTDGSNNAYDSKDVVEYYSDKQKVPYEDISTVGTKKNPYVFKLSEDQGFVYGKLFLDNKNLNSYFRFDVYTNDGEISSSWLVRCDKFATKQSMNEGDMYSMISHTKEKQKYIETEQNPSPDNTSGYTEIELAKAIRDKKQALKTLDLDLRKAKLSLSENKALLNDGIVRAKRSGIVRNIKDLSNPIQDGSAFLEVATGQGTYIKGNISELMLNQVKVGDTVSAYCWTNGETFDAKIQSVDTVPSSSSNYNGSGNPNVSYYGFEAIAKDASNIAVGEYLELTFNSNTDTTSSIWLSKAYVKQEGSKYYVLKENHGRLKKQYVTVGKIVWGDTMEIKDGLSGTDYIAFAYSKNAKEGVKAQKSSEDAS